MSRQTGTCNQCGARAQLARRKDGLDWRALYWCTECNYVAFGGDSFVRVPEERVMELPIAGPNDRQGKLL